MSNINLHARLHRLRSRGRSLTRWTLSSLPSTPVPLVCSSCFVQVYAKEGRPPKKVATFCCSCFCFVQGRPKKAWSNPWARTLRPSNIQVKNKASKESHTVIRMTRLHVIHNFRTCPSTSSCASQVCVYAFLLCVCRFSPLPRGQYRSRPAGGELSRPRLLVAAQFAWRRGR